VAVAASLWWPNHPLAAGAQYHVADAISGIYPSAHAANASRCRRLVQLGNRDGGPNVEAGMDDDEREALRAEGLDPDDPAVVAAIDLVRWELSLCAWVPWDDSGRLCGPLRSSQLGRSGAVRHAEPI
jgi:hypothetical protein